MRRPLQEKERQEFIALIKMNDRTYDYNAVNFQYYTDRDLIILKKILERKAKTYKIPAFQHFRKAHM